MKKMTIKLLIACCFVMIACNENNKNEKTEDLTSILPEILELNEKKPQVLMLGTFHFKDAGLDTYKPKHSIDIFSKKKQTELNEVIEALEKFNPTKIIVERRPDYQPKLDSLYEEYKKGRFNSANEITQIGFNLAKRLGHNRVIAGDNKARGLPWKKGDAVKIEKQIKEIIEAEKINEIIQSKYEDLFTKLYSYEDSLKTKVPLKEYFLYLNSEQRLEGYFGSYLTGTIAVNNGRDYPYADGLTGWWINRNYRIFSNIRKTIESENDRILVIFGAAHIGVLRPLVKASPEMQMIEVKDIL